MLKRNSPDSFSDKLINIKILNEDLDSWSENSRTLLFILLGAIEASELIQAYTSSLWPVIGLFEKMRINNHMFLPFWIRGHSNEFLNWNTFDNILEDLKKLETGNIRQPNTFPENITFGNYIPEDFTFSIICPKKKPRKCTKKWKKWCFCLKLLNEYVNRKTSYPLEFLAVRGWNNSELNLENNSQNILKMLLNHLNQKLPKTKVPQYCLLPCYKPPYIEMEFREKSKKADIDLKMNVWFHVLAHVSNSNEINSQSILQGINFFIGNLLIEIDLFTLDIVGNSLGLVFAQFGEIIL